MVWCITHADYIALIEGKFSMRSLSLSIIVASVALTGLSACGKSDSSTLTPSAANADGAAAAGASTAAMDPVLANPQVGDLWAAELSAFSAVQFNEGNSGQAQAKSYGLMKVVDVADDRVTVITEDAAWPNSRGAVNDLEGDQHDITWDEEERIPVIRANFAQLLADGKIVQVRRLSGGAAAPAAAAPATGGAK